MLCILTWSYTKSFYKLSFLKIEFQLSFRNNKLKKKKKVENLVFLILICPKHIQLKLQQNGYLKKDFNFLFVTRRKYPEKFC